MKKIILSMLFAFFAFTSFAMPVKVEQKEKIKTEQNLISVDVISVNAVHQNVFKLNSDAVIIDNSVKLDWKMWQHYFYSEKLTEDFNIKFKDNVFSGSYIDIRN